METQEQKEQSYVLLKKVEVVLNELMDDKDIVEQAIQLLSENVVKVAQENTNLESDSPDEAGEEPSRSEDESKSPKEKKQYIILVADADGVIPEGTELTGWVVQIPENDSVVSVQEKINKAAYNFNTSKKGRKNPIHNVGEALEDIPSKYFKQEKIAIKTKTPVFVNITDNKIPKE